MEDPASLGWSIFLISILFIVYSTTLYIKECSIEASADHFLLKRLHKLLQLKWNALRLLSMLCLLWMGGLLYHIQVIVIEAFYAPNSMASTLTLLGTSISSFIWLALLFLLHQIWIPRLLGSSIVKHTQTKNLFFVNKKEGKDVDTQKALNKLGEKTAREVMTPRLDMICLQWNHSFSSNLEIAVAHMKTRYPIVKDDKDDIIGFVHMKDLLARYDDFGDDQKWRQSIRPIITVPDSMSISRLLSMMQSEKTQIALLIDEYGGTSGMATLEDILEEIVGDIQDEFDQEKHELLMVQPNYYQLNAKLLVEEVNSYFQIELEVDNMDSIGGYMYANIQFPPHIGQSVKYDSSHASYLFTIEQMDQLRITQVGVRKTLYNIRSNEN